MLHKKFIVGAYAASINSTPWNRAGESAFFEHLKNREMIRGLEHAFYGKLHRFDDSWFLNNVNPEWEYAFTTIPGAMDLVAADSKIGLASKAEDGRKRALDFIYEANQAVKKLNSHHQKPSVIAVQIHSTPPGGGIDEFIESLEIICSWDWDGAKILVEHCDRFKSDGSHVKGLLSLEDEVRAIEEVKSKNPQTSLGAMLNWARSVIEEKDTKNILNHINFLKSHSLLNAFIFSGTSDSKDSPYLYYGDKHAPPPTPYLEEILSPESIMTVTEIRRSLQLLPADLDYLGFKIMPLPKPNKVEATMIYIDYMIKILSEEIKQIKL
jgi:hypothetical protein